MHKSIFNKNRPSVGFLIWLTCDDILSTMKRHLKRYTSLTHYIEFLRRQPEHAQHVYAVIFAGSITALIAFVILYVDYGFWHERYVREDSLVVSATISAQEKAPESPSVMFSRFFSEAKDRLRDIKMPDKNTLQGTETYTSDSN